MQKEGNRDCKKRSCKEKLEASDPYYGGWLGRIMKEKTAVSMD